MQFLNLSVAESITSNQLPEQIDIVTALHACNTATDDAIRFALAKKRRAHRAGTLLSGGSGELFTEK